jgi:hypothetical protein
MKCYRVWFTNGSATLIDAWSEDGARKIVNALIYAGKYSGSIAKIECLD